MPTHRPTGVATRARTKGPVKLRPLSPRPSSRRQRPLWLRRQTIGIAVVFLAGLGFVAFLPPLPLLAAGQDLLLRTFGLGLALVIAGLSVLGGTILLGQERAFLRQWRATLGGLLLGLAAMGILAFLPPPRVGPLWPALDGEGLSTAGRLGALLAGSRELPAFLLLVLVAVAGTSLAWPTSPRRTWRALRRGGRRIAGLYYSPRLRAASRFTLQAASASLRTLRSVPGRLRRVRLTWPRAAAEPAPPGRRRVRTNPTPAPAPADAPPAGKISPVPATGAPTPSAAARSEEARGRSDRLPPIALLAEGGKEESRRLDRDKMESMLLGTLADFGVEEAHIVAVNQGPTITQFGLEPGWHIKRREVIEREPDGRPKRDAEGNPKVHWEEVSRTRVKVSRITSLANDLALALAAPSIRIEAPVPGRPYVGIEVPNSSAAVVTLRSVIESPSFQRLAPRSRLAIAMGKAVDGNCVAADLARMPHLLIAGSTGSGKSVCINAIVTCLLAHAVPEEVRMLMVDPKRVELSGFNDVPHLLCPVVVDMDKVVGVLRWVAREMDDRYRKLAAAKVRNIEGYNRHPLPGEGPLPYLVVIIDELADLMMVAPDEVERIICRLAQLARATGIHLVVATQRPSVDVVTGLIKANFPTRISFAVTSQVDSRTILDMGGAEKLLGRGDMLYMPTDAAKPVRLQGVYVADAEIESVVNFWKGLRSPHYVPNFDEEAARLAQEDEEDEALLEKVRQMGREMPLSVSLLQRRLRLGYPRAARLLEIVEQEGAAGSGEERGRDIKADEVKE